MLCHFSFLISTILLICEFPSLCAGKGSRGRKAKVGMGTKLTFTSKHTKKSQRAQSQPTTSYQFPVPPLGPCGPVHSKECKSSELRVKSLRVFAHNTVPSQNCSLFIEKSSTGALQPVTRDQQPVTSNQFPVKS